MIRLRLLRTGLLGALPLATGSAALSQITTTTPPAAPVAQPYSNDPADQLAMNLRTLAVAPRSFGALVGAGDAALALGDANAALGFFARAEEVDRNSGRAKAGLASALVMLEKPDEALRLFAQAQSLGVPEAAIARDRGLAYDLRGDQRSAQRDYALALRAKPDDEVTRRYALSLGISGDRAHAMALLDPLLRAKDQSAWRARAFIFAMTGDVSGANNIARAVMPSSMASQLQPFMTRLATLNPADRAHAVNFGTMPATGQSIASVQPGDPYRNPAGATPVQVGQEQTLIPSGQPLGRDAPDPVAAQAAQQMRARRGGHAVAVAAPAGPQLLPDNALPPRPVAPTEPSYTVPAPSAPVQVASAYPATMGAPRYATPAPVTPAPAVASPPAASVVASTTQRVGQRIGPVDPNRLPPELRAAAPAPASTASAATPGTTIASTVSAPAVQIASAPTALPPSSTGITVLPRGTSLPLPTGVPAAVSTTPARVVSVTPTPVTAAPPPSPAPAVVKPVTTAAATVVPDRILTTPSAAPPNVATPNIVAPPSAPPVTVPAPVQSVAVAPAAITPAAASPATTSIPTPPPAPVPVPPAPVAVAASPPAPAPGFTSTGIVGPPAGPTSVPQSALAATPATPTPVAMTPVATAPVTTAPPVSAPNPVAAAPVTPAPAAPGGSRLSGLLADIQPEQETKPVALPTAAELRARRRAQEAREKAAADAAAAKEEAAARADAAAKAEAAEKAQLLKDNPTRSWVQIATGSMRGMTTTWSKLRGDHSALKGRSAWTLSGRASARLLVGPMKSASDARALVNTLGKDGLSASVYQSSVGEEVARLGGK